MTRNWLVAIPLFWALSLSPLAAFADETIGTLTLDGLSFISFGDQEILPIPSGSTVRFRFGDANPNGTVPFTIRPSDILILPIQFGDGTLEYSIGEAATGTMRPSQGGRILDFNASVNAKLTRVDGTGGTMVYGMPFSTESESASDLANTHTIEITGMRLIEGIWYVQIVGATTNKTNAYPEPGTAVYTVLSGRFDQIP